MSQFEEKVYRQVLRCISNPYSNVVLTRESLVELVRDFAGTINQGYMTNFPCNVEKVSNQLEWILSLQS